MANINTKPGIHPHFIMHRFSDQERSVFPNLAQNWYLTSHGKELHLHGSTYDYFMMKPTKEASLMFNLEREIICIFSPYQNF